MYYQTLVWTFYPVPRACVKYLSISVALMGTLQTVGSSMLHHYDDLMWLALAAENGVCVIACELISAVSELNYCHVGSSTEIAFPVRHLHVFDVHYYHFHPLTTNSLKHADRKRCCFCGFFQAYSCRTIDNCSVQRFPPFDHLKLSMVIVWRLRGNVFRTVLYCECATSSIGMVYKNSSYSLVGPWVCLFLGCMILKMFFVSFTLDSWVILLHVLVLV